MNCVSKILKNDDALMVKFVGGLWEFEALTSTLDFEQ
jgi:hypothetical protein